MESGSTNSSESLRAKLAAVKEAKVAEEIGKVNEKRELRIQTKETKKQERAQKRAEMKEKIVSKFDGAKETVAKFRKRDREGTAGLWAVVKASPEIGGIVGRAAVDKGKEIGTAALQGTEKGIRTVGRFAIETGKKMWLNGVELPFEAAVGLGFLAVVGTENYVTEKWEQTQEWGRKTVEKATNLIDRADNKIESWKQAGRDFKDAAVEGAKEAGRDIRDSYNNTRDELVNSFKESVTFVGDKGVELVNGIEDGITKIRAGAEKVRADFYGEVAELSSKGAFGIVEFASKGLEFSTKMQERNASIMESRAKLEASLHSNK